LNCESGQPTQSVWCLCRADVPRLPSVLSWSPATEPVKRFGSWPSGSASTARRSRLHWSERGVERRDRVRRVVDLGLAHELHAAGLSITAAARVLGIGRTTLVKARRSRSHNAVRSNFRGTTLASM
jgi:hypothetical protein